MEIWDIYNADQTLTGRTVGRGQNMKKGDYHLTIHVCIFNSENKMLIQQRQPWKDWPDMWDVTVGGSALSGETSIQAAQRETLEEIGYKLDLSDERPYFTINFERGFDDFYLIKRDIDISALTLQEEEVKAVKWASKDEIMQMIQQGKFIDYYFAQILFEMRKLRGSHRNK